MFSPGSTTNGPHRLRPKSVFSLRELVHLEKVKIMLVTHINFKLHFPSLSFFSFLFYSAFSRFWSLTISRNLIMHASYDSTSDKQIYLAIPTTGISAWTKEACILVPMHWNRVSNNIFAFTAQR